MYRPKSTGPSMVTAAVACFGVAAVIALFCVTSKQQPAQALSKGTPCAPMQITAQQPLGPSLPSIDLIPKPTERMTILLMGVDSNGRDTDPFLGTRSDTMMLVGIDPITNHVGVISIPRDSRVRIPKHGVEKINSAHAFGGPELAMETVREAFGVPVDHYIEVDTGGLKKLFEILGPVEILVEKEMHYTDHSAKLHVDLKPGLQTLSAKQAEEYVRFRHDARGDIGRIERQQWFIRQAAKKFKEPAIVLKLPQLVCLGYDCIRTDLPIQDILSLAAYAKDFPHERVVTAMLPGEGQMIGGGSYWVPDALAGQAMFSRILGCSTSGIRDPLQPSSLSTASDITPYSGYPTNGTGTDTSSGYASGTGNAYAATNSESTSGTGITTQYNTSGNAENPAPGSAELTLAEDRLPPRLAPGLRYDYSKPASVSIKYPKGSEKLVESIAENLTKSGFNVRYRWQIPEVECQHEMLVQQSLRANDEETAKIYKTIPEMEHYPVSVAIESRPASDFTIVVSPLSQLPSIFKLVEYGPEPPPKGDGKTADSETNPRTGKSNDSKTGAISNAGNVRNR